MKNLNFLFLNKIFILPRSALYFFYDFLREKHMVCSNVKRSSSIKVLFIDSTLLSTYILLIIITRNYVYVMIYWLIISKNILHYFLSQRNVIKTGRRFTGFIGFVESKNRSYFYFFFEKSVCE